MALDVLQNYAEATVTTALNGTDAAGTSDTVTISALNGAWVGLATGQQMRVADKVDVNAGVGYEIMILTANNGGGAGSWTLTRGAEGSTVKAHNANWTLVPVSTAGGLDSHYAAGMNQPPAGTWLPFVQSSQNMGLYSLPTDGTARYIGFRVSSPITPKGMAMFINQAGSTGCVMRQGIYAPNDGKTGPGALIADAGAFPADGTGTSNTALFAAPPTLPPGVYWAAAVIQGSPATAPQTYRGEILPWCIPGYDSNSIAAGWIAGLHRDTQSVATLGTGLVATASLSTSGTKGGAWDSTTQGWYPQWLTF